MQPSHYGGHSHRTGNYSQAQARTAVPQRVGQPQLAYSSGVSCCRFLRMEFTLNSVCPFEKLTSSQTSLVGGVERYSEYIYNAQNGSVAWITCVPPGPADGDGHIPDSVPIACICGVNRSPRSLHNCTRDNIPAIDCHRWVQKLRKDQTRMFLSGKTCLDSRILCSRYAINY